jgi:hypothetical protein
MRTPAEAKTIKARTVNDAKRRSILGSHHASLPRGHARAFGQQDKRIVDYDGDRLNGCAVEFSRDTIGRNRDAAAFHW